MGGQGLKVAPGTLLACERWQVGGREVSTEGKQGYFFVWEDRALEVGMSRERTPGDAKHGFDRFYGR